MRNKVYSDYAFIPYYGWSINIYIYLYILYQPEFSKKEAVVLERNLPRIMLFVMNVFKRIVRSFCSLFLPLIWWLFLALQVVSQLPFSRPCRSVCSQSMPINDRLGVIKAAKVYQREQQRLRTESRLAQLGQDQRELELREVLILFAFIWAVGIVLFYARLYLGPST